MTATKTRKKATKNVSETAVSAASPMPATGKRGRRKATGTQEQPARSPGEQEICDRYPTHTIKPGSLLWADHPDNPFRGKRVVTIICPCGTERVLCTSDLHHVRHCKSCVIDVKKNRRRTKEVKQSQ